MRSLSVPGLFTSTMGLAHAVASVTIARFFSSTFSSSGAFGRCLYLKGTLGAGCMVG